MAKQKSAKGLVMQPKFRMRVEKDKKKNYTRKAKHKNRGLYSDRDSFLYPSYIFAL